MTSSPDALCHVKYKDSMIQMIFERKYIVCFVTAFSCLVVLTIIGMLYGYNVDYAIANQTCTELSNMFVDISIASIFINNSYIALIGLIPVYGVLSTFIIAFNTGYSVGCIGQVANVPLTHVFSVYFFDLIFVIEYFAYSLAVGESIYLTYIVLKEGKREFIDRLRYETWKLAILIVILLLIGAVIEWFIIIS